MSVPADQPAPDLTPSEILNEMQNLTDIEADLADTALAVAAPATIDSENMALSAGEAVEALLDNAEQVESVLEEAIPSAPSFPSTDLQVEGSLIPDAGESSMQSSDAAEPLKLESANEAAEPTDISTTIEADAVEPQGTTLSTSEAADASIEALAVVA